MERYFNPKLARVRTIITPDFASITAHHRNQLAEELLTYMYSEATRSSQPAGQLAQNQRMVSPIAGLLFSSIAVIVIIALGVWSRHRP